MRAAKLLRAPLKALAWLGLISGEPSRQAVKARRHEQQSAFRESDAASIQAASRLF